VGLVAYALLAKTAALSWGRRRFPWCGTRRSWR